MVEVQRPPSLRLRASPPARVYIVGSDDLAYAPEGKLVRIAWSSGDYFYHHGSGEDRHAGILDPAIHTSRTLFMSRFSTQRC